MAQQIQGVVGPQYLADGVPGVPSLERTGGFRIVQAHGRYHEAVMRGNVYTYGLLAVCTFGTALTATMVTLSLTNPAGSGKNLSILRGTATVVTSSTAGSLVWAACVNPVAAAVVHGTPGIAYNCLLGSGNKPVGLVDSASTLPAAPTMLRPMAFGPVTATATTGSIIDTVDGEFVLTPGTAITIQGLTIVGTGLLSITWEEVVP
jgi:hypothetical protein